MAHGTNDLSRKHKSASFSLSYESQRLPPRKMIEFSPCPYIDPSQFLLSPSKQNVGEKELNVD